MVLIFVQFLVFGVSAAIAITTITMWRTPRAKYFIFLTLAISLYAAGYLLELNAHSLDAAYTAQQAQYLGIPFIGVLFFLFMRDYTKRPVRRGVMAALFILPVFVMVMVNGYPELTLYYHHLDFLAQPSPHLVVTPGPLFYIEVVYSYGLMLLGSVEMIRFFPKQTKKDRQQIVLFVVAIALPVAAILFLVIDRTPNPMDFSSMALTASILIIEVYILRNRVQEWLPVMREQVIQKMEDGYILVDREGCFLDANRVALHYFPALREACAGAPLAGVPGIPANLLSKPGTLVDFSLEYGREKLSLRAASTHIPYGGQKVGTCIMIYDMTELRRAIDELERMATHDSLTGLLNRATFFRIAGRDFNLSRRTNIPTALLMLDIDHFKGINDKYGHPVGDEVLCSVAASLEARLRATDIRGRYGGEEFCVYLPAAKLAAAWRIAEDIRRCIEEKTFTSGYEEFGITISIGVAQLCHDRHHTLEDLIAEADEALYRAKNNGRNQTALSSWRGSGGPPGKPG